MTYLKQAWAFVRKWWWAMVAGLVGVFVWMLSSGGDDGKLPGPSPGNGGDDSALEGSKRAIEERIKRAEQDAKIESKKRDASASMQRERLEEIKREDDVEERRRKLSNYLSEEL